MFTKLKQCKQTTGAKSVVRGAEMHRTGGKIHVIIHNVVPLNNGNCRLTIHMVKGRFAREALPHAFNIGLFKYSNRNPTTIKHIYN